MANGKSNRKTPVTPELVREVVREELLLLVRNVLGWVWYVVKWVFGIAIPIAVALLARLI